MRQILPCKRLPLSQCIKCKLDWKGETVFHDDDAKQECFRAYPNVNSSFKDHSDFLKTSQRYTALFTLDPMDYKGWAYGLKRAGYATNPKYPQVLIKLIEDYQLQDYTLLALDKWPVKETITEKEPVKILVTSGASCPDALVEGVIKKLSDFFPVKRNIEELIEQFR